MKPRPIAGFQDYFVFWPLKAKSPCRHLSSNTFKRAALHRSLGKSGYGKSFLATELERVCCPRAYFKLMIFDTETAYIGSANLTSANMEMKSENRHNFEVAILTKKDDYT